MSRPSDLHEARREALDTLAILGGFTVALPSFPDGHRPDVLRLSPAWARRALFVGDAKAWETSGRQETLVRLTSYARWLTAAVGAGAVGVLAVCCDRADGRSWAKALRSLAYEITRREGTVAVSDLSSWAIVTWTLDPAA
jgi:hypothetical protein